MYYYNQVSIADFTSPFLCTEGNTEGEVVTYLNNKTKAEQIALGAKLALQKTKKQIPKAVLAVKKAC